MVQQRNHLRASISRSWRAWPALNVKGKKRSSKKLWVQCIQVKRHISWFLYMALTRLRFQLVQTPCVFQDINGGFLLTLTSKTVSSMYSLFLALVLFPLVQRRAQAELDAVVGRDRFPTFDDRPRLPYIEALCKELLRWQMVTPLGMTSSEESRQSG